MLILSTSRVEIKASARGYHYRAEALHTTCLRRRPYALASSHKSTPDQCTAPYRRAFSAEMKAGYSFILRDTVMSKVYTNPQAIRPGLKARGKLPFFRQVAKLPPYLCANLRSTDTLHLGAAQSSISMQDCYRGEKERFCS